MSRPGPSNRTTDTDLAIVGAGVSACSLVAALRRRGWTGSITMLESGRGVGGRASTRRSRHDPGLQIDHGAPLFNITAAPANNGVAALIDALAAGDWIRPFTGAICSIDADGQIGPAQGDDFSEGALWHGNGGMDQLAAGLLQLAGQQQGVTTLRCSTVVRQLMPSPQGWSLHDIDGAKLLHCRWLVLSGTLLAHPRCQKVFGWDAVPLQQAAAELQDAQLNAAAAQLATLEAIASSNLLLKLPADLVSLWLQQPWRLLQFSPDAQQRWGLRRVSLQQPRHGGLAIVAESSSVVADQYSQIYGSRSSAAQLLGTAPDADAEAMVIDALRQNLESAVDCSCTGADAQLMRWGAAFPLTPGLHNEQQLCSHSRIGFCGDYVCNHGFGRIEGALASAEALADRLIQAL